MCVVSGPGVGLGDPERDVQRPVGDVGQVLLLHLLAAVDDHRVHAEHREVQRRRAVHAGAGRGHLLEHRRRLADALPAAAVALRDGDADPAALGHRRVELAGEPVLLVARRPVVVVEAAADGPDGLADRIERVVVAHAAILTDRRSVPRRRRRSAPPAAPSRTQRGDEVRQPPRREDHAVGAGRGELGGGPPAQLVHPLGEQLVPRQRRRRGEHRGAHEVDVVALAVPAAVEERDHGGAGPDVRPDVGVAQPELLVELPAQRRLVVLAELLAAARRGPDGHGGELEPHEHDAVVGVEDGAAHRPADPQAREVRAVAVRHSSGCSGRSPLNDLYIS